MKKLIFFSLLLCIQMNSYAQQPYVLSGSFLDGRTVKDNEVLFLNDSCLFKVKGQQDSVYVDDCVWEFKALAKDGVSYIVIDKARSKTFNVNIDSILYRDYNLCYRFMRKMFDGDRSIYYTAIVSCAMELSSGQDVNLEMPVLVNLLPSKPEIKVLNFEYSVYDAPFYYFEDGLLTYQVISERCDRLFVQQANLFSHGGFIGFYQFFDDPINQIVRAECLDADVYYRFYAENENAHMTVTSDDTIRMDQFIPTTSVERIPAGGESISYSLSSSKDVLHLKGDISNMLAIDIYNARGQKIRRINEITSSIDIFDLPSGLYLISFFDRRNNGGKTLKFVK